MYLSYLVMYFIILVTALALGAHGIHTIDSAAGAANALRPLAGPLTFLLFALGIVSAGLMSIPVMAATSAYAICGAFNLRASLAKTPAQEPAFYWVIVGSCLIGLLVNLLPVPPFKLLYYTAVLNGFIAPPLLFMILRITNNRKIMGPHTNSLTSNLLGWLLFALMSASLVALVFFP